MRRLFLLFTSFRFAGSLFASGPDAAPARTPTPAPRNGIVESMPGVSRAGTPTPTPLTARQKALDDIAHAFDDMEKTLERTYGKQIDEAKRKRQIVFERLQTLRGHIAVARAEGRPDKEIDSMKVQDYELQKQLLQLDHEIEKLQMERRKALDDLRLKKQKALDDAKKALDQGKNVPTPAPSP